MSRMRAFRSALASTVILVVVAAAPAYPWHGSGTITVLAIDPRTPTTLYAGTCDRGVFKSTDGGASWSATGLSNTYVSALAIDPQTPTTLYAVAAVNDCATRAALPGYEAGVFKSTDGGATWTATGLSGIYVTALAVDPQTPTTLYAGTYSNGVFKSTDGGATWSATGLTVTAIAPLVAIDPLMPTTLYAGTSYCAGTSYPGLCKSTDGGTSWSAILTTDPASYASCCSSLAIDARTGTIVAGVDYVTPQGGIWTDVVKSTDGGAGWSAILFTYYAPVLAIDPLTPTTLYAVIPEGDYLPAGVNKSTDGGATWTAVSRDLIDILLAYGVAYWGFPSPSIWPLAIDPLTPTTVYAGTSVGVFKSTDGGATWSATGLIQHSPLSTVSLNPDSVASGAASTGTVTLITAAAAGGVTLTLSSSNPAVATVPPSVTVAPEATNATFMVSTSPVTVPTWVTISAAFDDAIRSAQLYVSLPMPLSFVSVNPTSVTGGTDSTGTVTLSAAAPADGAVVTLSSGDSAVAMVPASVTVPGGATSATFTISTNPVAASTWVTISGTFGGVTKGTWLLVTSAAPTLSSVSLNPTSAPGGSPSTGTVTLSAAAPAGGAAVTLSSSNASVATVPGSVTVPAGATSANFTASTAACTSGSVTISGGYGGVTKSAGLTVTATTDTVAIQRADYFATRRELRVAATSTSYAATLQVYVTSAGDLIGTLRNLSDGKYSGQFTWPVNPQNITVRSSSCGSATSAVKAR